MNIKRLRVNPLSANPTQKKTFKTLWPLFMDRVQLLQGYSHFEEAVYFLPLSSNTQTHSNNSSAKADKLFECV